MDAIRLWEIQRLSKCLAALGLALSSSGVFCADTITILSPALSAPNPGQSKDSSTLQKISSGEAQPNPGQAKDSISLEKFSPTLYLSRPITNSDKAPPEVMTKAKAGQSQELIVRFDVVDIDQAFAEKKKLRNIQFEDKAMTDEIRTEYKRIKNQVFPNGKLSDATVLEDFDNVPMLFVSVSNQAALEKLLAHSRVKQIYENVMVQKRVAQGLPLIGLPNKYPYTNTSGFTGVGTRVAILDTGANYALNDFSTDNNAMGCRRSGDKYTTGNFVGAGGRCRISNYVNFLDRETTLEDEDQSGKHGTTVAAIAAATAMGTKLDILKVLSASGGASTTNIGRALNWVISSADSGPERLVAMNMSFGTETYYTGECPNSFYADFFRRMRAKGVVPIVASGNGGKSNMMADPSCVSEAVTVGAVYDSNVGSFTAPNVPCTNSSTAADLITCYTDRNYLLTLLAPGSTSCGKNTCGNGTSFAAPYVTGAAAILRAPNAFPSEPVSNTILRMTASGASLKDPVNQLNYPRLNVSAAIAYKPAGGSMGAAINILLLSADDDF